MQTTVQCNQIPVSFETHMAAVRLVKLQLSLPQHFCPGSWQSVSLHLKDGSQLHCVAPWTFQQPEQCRVHPILFRFFFQLNMEYVKFLGNRKMFTCCHFKVRNFHVGIFDKRSQCRWYVWDCTFLHYQFDVIHLCWILCNARDKPSI